MPTVTCNACNAGFDDEEQQRLHYRSEWHRYNLKRKVAGVPGVTEALFLARQTALAEGSNSDSTPMLYSCALCGKEYRSSKAHAQHLNSRSHLMKASQEPNASIAGITIVKPRPERVQRRAPSAVEEDEDEDEEEEWVEVDPNDKDNIELGSGGAELVITNKSEKGTRVRTLGSREFIRYYRQKPRPSVATDRALALSLASSYKSMGLVTVQSKEQVVRLKVLRAMNKTGVETMRTKIGMKSNVKRDFILQ
uniref:C2H2-type domain-containing protein n=1 Tax=Oryza rufipogon TaxID=4529 RepID=A0A0E0Q211_ORYRU